MSLCGTVTPSGKVLKVCWAVKIIEFTHPPALYQSLHTSHPAHTKGESPFTHFLPFPFSSSPSSCPTVSAARRCESVTWDAMLGLCLCSVQCAACSKIVGVTILAANRVDCVETYVNKVSSTTSANTRCVHTETPPQLLSI